MPRYALYVFVVLMQFSLIGNVYASDLQIWFGPNISAEDFNDIFAEDAPWESVRSQINVFTTHMNWLGDARRDSLEQKIVPFIQRTGIELALEVGGLRSHNLHGRPADQLGEITAEYELNLIHHIYRMGGEVNYLQMDSPIGYTLASGGDTLAAFTPEEAARETADYMEAILAILPYMKFVLIEPIPWYRVGNFPATPPQDRGDLLEILQTFIDTLNARDLTLHAFHADCPFNFAEGIRYDGWGKLVALQEWVTDQDIRFGLINNDARGGGSSDSLFYENSLKSVERFLSAGGTQDNFVAMSWYDHPTRILPEDKQYSYTYLMRHYIDKLLVSVNDQEHHYLPQSLMIDAYPNPFNSQLRINLLSPFNQNAELRIFDAHGRLTAVFSGVNKRVLWDAGNIPTGWYRLELRDQGQSTGKNVLLIR